MTITAAASLGSAPRRQKQTTSLFVSLTISTRFFSFSFLLSSSLLFNSYAVVISRLVFHSNWHFQIQSSFRAVSEQFQSSCLRQFQGHFGPIAFPFQCSFTRVSKQLQSSFRTVSEQFVRNFRAISVQQPFRSGAVSQGFSESRPKHQHQQQK